MSCPSYLFIFRAYGLHTASVYPVDVPKATLKAENGEFDILHSKFFQLGQERLRRS